MARDRDVDAFDRRAGTYESGPLAQWHAEVVAAARALAVSVAPAPPHVVDVGCGTGALVRLLAADLPATVSLTGVDAAPAMIAAAAAHPGLDPRVTFSVARAEALPMADAVADLVVSTTSFDHWHGQLLGLLECRRVLRPGGRLVLVDLCSPLLWPTTRVGRRGRARTPRQLRDVLTAAALRVDDVSRVSLLIRAAVCTRP